MSNIINFLMTSFCGCLALSIETPSSVAGQIESPIYNRRIGLQTTNLDIIAQASFTKYGECVSADPLLYKDRVVVLENDSDLFLSYAVEQREAACLERKGALGVVRLQKSISVAG